MPPKPQPRQIRVVVFDDQPGQLLEAVRTIQKELLTAERIQIQVQAYRMDWLYQAQQEIEEHGARIVMIWLIDLHQQYAVDDRVRASATGLIDDLGDEARAAIKELYRTAAENLAQDQQIVPDGVALIAKARERNIPFFVSSKYLMIEHVAPLLRKIAIGDNYAGTDDWELRKIGGEIEAQSRDRLKSRIVELAQPFTTDLATLFDKRTRWHSHPTLANTIMAIALVVAAYLGYKQYVTSQKSVDLSTNQPEYLAAKLIFSSTEQTLEWNLLDKGQLSGLPRLGQVANLELETKKADNQLLVLWYMVGSKKPTIEGPKRASLQSHVGSNPRYPLEAGSYVALLLLSNDVPPLGFIAQLEKSLVIEVDKLSNDLREANGAWLCDKGSVSSVSREVSDKRWVIESLCDRMTHEFEAPDPKNRKLSMLFFSMK